MRPFFVVALQPAFRDLAHLFQVLEQMRAQYLLAIGLVEAFNIGILVRFAGLDVAQLDAVSLAPVNQYL